MEILSNLTWIAVALALLVVWVGQQRRTRGQTMLPGTAVQMIALAILAVILLPAISVSDDLQASHNPAEVERACARSDQHVLLMADSHATPVALAVIFSVLADAAPQRMAWFSVEYPPAQEPTSHARVPESRGPPAA